MPALDDLQSFNIDGATATLWIFKKSSQDGAPRFKGRWVETSEALDGALKAAVAGERGRIQEVIEYGLLAQNNEASALSIEIDETHAGLIVDETDAETQNKKITVIKDIRNASFYVIKLVQGEDVIHAVKKADSSWKTKRSIGIISAVFADQQLGLDESPTFDIARSVDFFIVGDSILVANKGSFESVLSYKEAHKDDFAALQGEPQFIAILSDLAPIVAFVGENKIQLRRAAAIRQKGYYANAAFMNNLRARRAELGFTFNFDAQGRIVPTPESCREIFTALLDHRLTSRLSESIYDVQDAVSVDV